MYLGYINHPCVINPNVLRKAKIECNFGLSERNRVRVKGEFFLMKNNPKILDPSCKTDLDVLVCFGREK